MPYVSKLLTRITPGEVGRNQAVIDYFYYDPETTIEEMLSKGFFDKAGYLFYKEGANRNRTYERIHLWAKRGTGIDPSIPDRYSCLVSDVTVTSPPGATPTEFEVTVSLGPETTPQVDTTLAPLPGPIAWQHYFIKYQGLVRFNSFGTAGVGNETYFYIPSKYLYENSDFVTCNLIGTSPGQPAPFPGDNIIGAYCEPGPSPEFPYKVVLFQTLPTSNTGQRMWLTIRGTNCQFS